jgi:hypothetical protein
MEPIGNKLRFQILSCATFVQMLLHGKGKKRGEVMKRSIVWDITPCTPLKVNLRFGGECRLHLQVRRRSRTRNGRESRRQAEFLPQFLSRLVLRSWRWTRHVPPKRRLNFNGLHDGISKKTELFITTAVRTSNPTMVKLSLCLNN